MINIILMRGKLKAQGPNMAPVNTLYGPQNDLLKVKHFYYFAFYLKTELYLALTSHDGQIWSHKKINSNFSVIFDFNMEKMTKRQMKQMKLLMRNPQPGKTCGIWLEVKNWLKLALCLKRIGSFDPFVIEFDTPAERLMQKSHFYSF